MKGFQALIAMALTALMFAGFVSASYVGIAYFSGERESVKVRAAALVYGDGSYAMGPTDYAYGYSQTYASPYYTLNSYDAYPYSGPSFPLSGPNYAGYETATFGTRSASSPSFNCNKISLSNAEVIVPRGSAGEAELILRNRSGQRITVNSVSVQDTLNTRAGNAAQNRSVINNRRGTSIRVPVSAAFDAQEGSAALNVQANVQGLNGRGCTVSGTVKATLTGDGSFGNYDRRMIVYPNNRDYGTARSVSFDIPHNSAFDP